MLVKNILLAIIGLAGAGFVAAGTFAFITMLGIVPRLAGRTGTARSILLYEDMIIAGGTIGNFLIIIQPSLNFGNELLNGQLLLIFFGFFSGIFVGCLAVALAELLQVFPVFAKRVRLLTGMPIIVVAIALGKLVGALVQIWIGWR